MFKQKTNITETDFYNNEDIIFIELFKKTFIEIRGLMITKNYEKHSTEISLFLNFEDNFFSVHFLDEDFTTFPENITHHIEKLKENNLIYIKYLNQKIEEQEKDIFKLIFKTSLEKNLKTKKENIKKIIKI